MKKKIVLISIIATTSMSFAQQNKVVSAWKYLNDFYSYKEVSSLAKAKEAIDLASEHADTRDGAKTWLYRGKVYQAVYEQNFKVELEKLTDITDNNKKTLTAYQNTPTNELDQAQQAYAKTRQLDEKKIYFQESTQKLNECSRHFENRGIALYNAKLYADALPAFESAIAVNTLLGQVDTTNTNNAALVAERSKNYDKAKVYYQKLADLKYGNANTYAALSSVYQNMGDTLGAFEVVKKGRVAYPDDVNLLIAETNSYLKQNKTDEAINNLKLTIQKRPGDANLYLVLGNLYDNLANPQDAKGKDTEKPKNYEELFKLAEENYKKAIEFQPDYFDGLYNIGVLYNNHGVTITKQADSIKDNAKYAAENAKANEEFKKALPYLEKARTLNGSDRNLLIALKQLYARTNQPEKVKEVNDLLKN